MSLLHADRPRAELSPLAHADLRIWFEGGVPYGLVWEGRYYRVTDTPTHLEDDFASLTHPLDLVGWRFQGTNDDERSRMFDIRRFGDEWVVLRVYE